ncbi:uncharacterized protein METZ01_LOCUS280790, partial [marine metagenome]
VTPHPVTDDDGRLDGKFQVRGMTALVEDV